MMSCSCQEVEVKIQTNVEINYIIMSAPSRTSYYVHGLIVLAEGSSVDEIGAI